MTKVEHNGHTVTTEDNKLFLNGEEKQERSWPWVLGLVEGGEGYGELEKWLYEHAEYRTLLNYWDAAPDVDGGRVVAVIRSVGETEPRELTTEEYALLKLDLAPDAKDYGCVEEHPEGSDRGGYVPTLNDGTYYDENACEWF